MTARQRSILLVAILTQGISVGLTYGIFPVFLEPFEVAFDAPRTTISSGLIVIMVSLAVGSTLAGGVFDGGRARAPMLAAAFCFAGSLVVASTASSLWQLGLAAVMAGFAIPSVGPLAGAILLTRHFAADRGRALGLMSMGPPLGSGLFAWAAGALLVSIGWREALLVFAGVALVALVPLIVFVVPARLPPDPMLALLDADASAPPPDPEDGGSGGVGGLLRSPAFWWAASLFALMAGISQGWTAHVAAYLGGLGLDEVARSRLVALQYWLGVPGALFFGTMADRVGLSPLLFGMLGLAGGAFVIFAGGPTPLVATLVCAAFGFAFGGVVPLYMMLLGERLGADALGRAMGLSNVVMLPITAGSVLLAAAVFEATGGYRSALLVFAVGMGGAMGCLVGSNRSAARA